MIVAITQESIRIRSISKQFQKRYKMKKVALIGTSANPFTNAHLTMGLEILALTDVDEVWYYLSGEHPWGKKLMPAHHRVTMTKLAVADYSRLKVCTIEVDKADIIYKHERETAPILEKFILPTFPDHKFSWVLGSDVAQTFHKWGNAQWMADNLDIYIIHRLGYDFDKEGSILKDPKHIYFKDNIAVSNISSTLVRERGKSYDGNKLVALVPRVVWTYMEHYKLLNPEVLK